MFEYLDDNPVFSKSFEEESTMKKTLAFVLSATMMMAALVGCGSSETAETKAETTAETAGTEAEGDNGYTVDNECPLGPVVIEKIKVVSKSTWSIEDFNADYKNMRASSNKIGLSINGAAVQTNGTLTLNESLRSVIRNKESKALSFEAKLPAQRTAIQDNALGIVFTIDFDKAE